MRRFIVGRDDDGNPLYLNDKALIVFSAGGVQFSEYAKIKYLKDEWKFVLLIPDALCEPEKVISVKKIKAKK